MSLSIFCLNLTPRIDKNLSIEDAVTVPLRYPADDCDRTRPRNLLKLRDRPFRPGGRMSLNDRHRVAGICHLRKDDQLSACFSGPRGKLADFGEVRAENTERAGNLSGSDFHFAPYRVLSRP